MEFFGEDIHADAEVDPLDVAEGFPEAVCAEVSTKAQSPCPAFHEGIDRADGEGLVIPLPRAEEVVLISGFGELEIGVQRLMDAPVDEEPVGLAAPSLADVEGVASLKPPHVLDPELEDVSHAEAAVDADGEEEKIARVGRKEPPDLGDGLEAPYGLYGDSASPLGVIGILFHFRSLFPMLTLPAIIAPKLRLCKR